MTYKARLTCFHQVHFSVREIISTISGIIPIRVKQNTFPKVNENCGTTGKTKIFREQAAKI